MNATQPRFKILGINDDESTCSCCGKQGLKKVVWIEDTETGSLDHFGVICALKPAKCFGIGKKDLSSFETAWRHVIYQRIFVARKAYKAAGGTWKAISDDKGRPLNTEVENPELWATCMTDAAAKIKLLK